MECEFCRKTYPTQAKLNVHKKTSKICLKIQGKDENEDKKERRVEDKKENKLVNNEEKKEEDNDEDNDEDNEETETEIDVLYKETMGHTRSWVKSKREYMEASTKREKDLLLYSLQIEARLNEKDKYIVKLLDNLQDKFRQLAKAEVKIDRLEDTLWKIVKQSQDDL